MTGRYFEKTDPELQKRILRDRAVASCFRSLPLRDCHGGRLERGRHLASTRERVLPAAWRARTRSPDRARPAMTGRAAVVAFRWASISATASSLMERRRAHQQLEQDARPIA